MNLPYQKSIYNWPWRLVGWLIGRLKFRLTFHRRLWIALFSAVFAFFALSKYIWGIDRIDLVVDFFFCLIGCVVMCLFYSEKTP